jgi:hypothetical protein
VFHQILSVCKFHCWVYLKPPDRKLLFILKDDNGGLVECVIVHGIWEGYEPPSQILSIGPPSKAWKIFSSIEDESWFSYISVSPH